MTNDIVDEIISEKNDQIFRPYNAARDRRQSSF